MLALGLPRGSIKFCHVGCERNVGLMGRVEKVDGLNTSSESLESLGSGGIKVDCWDDFSVVGSISLVVLISTVISLFQAMLALFLGVCVSQHN